MGKLTQEQWVEENAGLPVDMDELMHDILYKVKEDQLLYKAAKKWADADEEMNNLLEELDFEWG